MLRAISISLMLFLTVSVQSQARDVTLRFSGKRAEGKVKVTDRIQDAIDRISESGGGTLTLTGGTFLTAPIELKDGVTLHIESDAVLSGSTDTRDYPNRQGPLHVYTDSLPRHRNVALIYADEARDIAITGKGTIDCNGSVFVREKSGPDWTGWHFERTVAPEESVARVVFFAGCSNVRVEDVTMTNQPAGWSYWIHDCDSVLFDRCRIMADVRYPNNDGIHVNSSRDVTIRNCQIETGDDSIVIRANNRSLKENKVCERVHVSNCDLRSWSSGVRIGWTNDGTIRDCHFRDINMHDCSNAVSCYLPDRKVVFKTNDFGREATYVENITFTNIDMDEIYGSAIYVNVSESDETRFAGFKDVSFENVTCRCLQLPYFCGRWDASVENVSFINCNFIKCRPDEFPGDGRRHGAVLTGKPGKSVVGVENLRFINSTITISQ